MKYFILLTTAIRTFFHSSNRKVLIMKLIVGISLLLGSTISNAERVQADKPTKVFTADNLIEDISALSKINMKRGKFETTEQYVKRIKPLFIKYDGREYKISLKCSNVNLLQYEPDTEYLEIDMGALQIGYPSARKISNSETESDEDYDYRSFEYSLLNLKQHGLKQTSMAQNAFGAKQKVTSNIIVSFGVAVLTSRSSEYGPQVYSTTLPINLARDVMERGRVILRVKTQIPYSEEGINVFDDFSFEKYTSPEMLITSTNTKQATFTDPTEEIKMSLSLPVRLLSISLVDGKGKEVFSDVGIDIDTDIYKEREVAADDSEGS